MKNVGVSRVFLPQHKKFLDFMFFNVSGGIQKNDLYYERYLCLYIKSLDARIRYFRGM